MSTRSLDQLLAAAVLASAANRGDTTGLRGRRANGQDLVIPKDVIRHGFRNIARDVATEWLAARTRDQAPPDGDRAVRARARELAGMRLAAETRRGVLTFEPDWQDRLKAMERHLDVRKRLPGQQRLRREAQERSRARLPGKGSGRQIPIYFLTHRRGARADPNAVCTKLQLARSDNVLALGDAQPFAAGRH